MFNEKYDKPNVNCFGDVHSVGTSILQKLPLCDYQNKKKEYKKIHCK